MKNLISTTLILIIFLSSSLNAQQISSVNYNKEFLHEDFNTEGEFFNIVTTTDNYFIIDKGDYLLSRNNNETEYAIIANKSSVSNFILKTAVRLGPSKNKNASIGIVIKAQQDGKGAIIFEINKKGEYRIKQLLKNTYKILSGSNKHEGWVKTKIINGVDEHNFIEIRTENNIYDVFVNSEYLTTFFIPDYINGSCGLIISSETKARVAYYHINIKGENTNSVTSFAEENSINRNTKIEELNRKITTLEANNAKLNSLNTEEIGNKERELKSLIEKNTKQTAITIEQEKKIESLNLSITDLKDNILKSEVINEKITKNKTKINNLIIEKNTLSTEVTSLKEDSSILSAKNSYLTDLSIKQEKKLVSLINAAENLDIIIEKINTENKELSSKINSLNTKNADFALITIEQEKELVSLKSKIKDLKSKSVITKSTNKQLTQKIDNLNKQFTLEKSVSTNLKNDLKMINKSSNSKITNLTNQINNLKNEINTKTNINISLSSDLSNEKKQHNKNKNNLTKIKTKKAAEIKALETNLYETSQQLKLAIKNGDLLKECSKNVVTLNSKLKSVNLDINRLTEIKNKHDEIVNNY